ncbi:bifunctional adenosylcobinamide kinase/adenosylcobinamide-phosphate guanylyltransferase [Rhodoferax sp.]|uniref:bifunctional adenosylcobinamide kinase/adenosylcobinamide-phosphate guanylyltransferase n=1 Tax=Rhodoferax sp. TaxID=50421 RepID=UPI00271B6103|nr:bifunctional adenosylcobinamide kinase/adenosylcobinamide-phosphate guanylyltransferase [Rhodoferax sp.]MDO9196599.1 bifunctional adenosylcobinamide kinase/adenosylcobinamide-phosphate guanylyltransferase [Rhodoferax sp.]
MDNTKLQLAYSELILGGQRSGKSRRAELLAQTWLGTSASHRAVLIATGQPGDEEMRQRIRRHQADRALRVPGMETVEEPLALAQTMTQYSRADTLVVVDCLTLWLTNQLMPVNQKFESNQALAPVNSAPVAMLLEAITQAPGPVVLVGNEIGMGVIPMGAQVRAFVDALGRLNQDVARVCQRVTLMVAGLPLNLKDAE